MTEMIDAHVHLVGRDEPSHPWLETPTGFVATSPAADSWWTRDDIHDDGAVANLDRAGVDMLIAVQSTSIYGYDNRYVIDAAARHPQRVTAVLGGDVDDERCPERLESEARLPGVVGVRFLAVTSSATWLGTDRLDDALDAAAGGGLVVQFAAHEHHLFLLEPAIARHGDLPVIIDHLAHPTLTAPDQRLPPDAPLLSLARLPNVHVKLSNLVLSRVGPPGPAALVTQLVAAFGAGRMLWGSDYPHTVGDGYTSLVEEARRSVSFLRDHEQRAVLGATAASLFGVVTDSPVSS